jgi:phage virion morphogenesis protein
MTGVRIAIEADDKLARQGLARLAATGADLAPTFRAIGARLVANTLQRFEDQRGPGGVPWKPSQRALDENGQTLIDSGRLRTSITFRAGANGVEVGTNVVYAAIHQFGGPIKQGARTGTLRFQGGRFARQRRNKDGSLKPPSKQQRDRQVQFGARSIGMPARPFIGFDAQDREDVADIILRHLRRAVRGATR